MPALAPAPKFRAVGADGLALVGGKLWSYTAGTSTPKATYTDFGIGTANTNPVILDSRGEASVWLDGNYKLTLLDADDVQIWSVDDIRDLTSSATFTNATLAGTLTVTSTAVTWSGNPTHSGNHTFTNNVVINGSTTLGDSSSDSLTIRPNAVTWTNGVTHAGANTFTDAVTLNGATTINGAATFPLVVSTHTFGATFGNVARAGLTTLDWYQEGTFTPTLVPAAGSGITYSAQLGLYTRIGNRVSFDVYLAVSALGTASGNVYIDGLPFTVITDITTGITSYSAAVGEYGNFVGLTGAVTASPLAASTRLQLRQMSATGVTTLTIATMSATSYICVSGVYRT